MFFILFIYSVFAQPSKIDQTPNFFKKHLQITYISAKKNWKSICIVTFFTFLLILTFYSNQETKKTTSKIRLQIPKEPRTHELTSKTYSEAFKEIKIKIKEIIPKNADIKDYYILFQIHCKQIDPDLEKEDNFPIPEDIKQILSNTTAKGLGGASPSTSPQRDRNNYFKTDNFYGSHLNGSNEIKMILKLDDYLAQDIADSKDQTEFTKIEAFLAIIHSQTLIYTFTNKISDE